MGGVHNDKIEGEKSMQSDRDTIINRNIGNHRKVTYISATSHTREKGSSIRPYLCLAGGVSVFFSHSGIYTRTKKVEKGNEREH